MTQTPYLTPGVADQATGVMQRAAGSLLPFARRNPAILAGFGAALVVGVLGVLAWRNRERIADTARPLLKDAADRGRALRARLPHRHHGEDRAQPAVH